MKVCKQIHKSTKQVHICKCFTYCLKLPQRPPEEGEKPPPPCIHPVDAIHNVHVSTVFVTSKKTLNFLFIEKGSVIHQIVSGHLFNRTLNKHSFKDVFVFVINRRLYKLKALLYVNYSIVERKHLQWILLKQFLASTIIA